METILEQASLAISQVILRKKVSEERKYHQEDDIISNLLKGDFNNVSKLDTLLPFSFKNACFRTIVIVFDDVAENNKDFNQPQEIMLRISSLLRNVLKEKSVTPVISLKDNEIRILSFSLQEKRAYSIYDEFSLFIKQNETINSLASNNYFIGISKEYDNYTHIPQSYREAKHVIELKYYQIIQTNLFDYIGIYAILLDMESENNIFPFIIFHIKPILNLDVNSKNNLLETLEVFLENNCSYNLAAEQLFVVRQTLYYRVNQIKKLLGDDFLYPPKRLSIEFSVKAYKYLKNRNPELFTNFL